MQTQQPRPHGNRLRSGRWSESGRVYLLTASTRNREPRFAEFETAAAVVRAFHAASFWEDTALLAWVLMPDHWHGLVQLGDRQDLASAVRKFKTITGRSCNTQQDRNGAVWQACYHDHALRYDEDIVQAARYLVMKPVRAGLVSRIGDYPFWNAVWL
jgi:putative transposase